MLCIGRALMTNPDVLLMDEPSEGSAPLIVAEVAHIISELHQSGLSILLVEQESEDGPFRGAIRLHHEQGDGRA